MKLPATQLTVKSPITVGHSENYAVIIADSNDTRHFFIKKGDELFYDGYCRDIDAENSEDDKPL